MHRPPAALSGRHDPPSLPCAPPPPDVPPINTPGSSTAPDPPSTAPDPPSTAPDAPSTPRRSRPPPSVPCFTDSDSDSESGAEDLCRHPAPPHPTPLKPCALHSTPLKPPALPHAYTPQPPAPHPTPLKPPAPTPGRAIPDASGRAWGHVPLPEPECLEGRWCETDAGVAEGPAARAPATATPGPRPLPVPGGDLPAPAGRLLGGVLASAPCLMSADMPGTVDAAGGARAPPAVGPGPPGGSPQPGSRPPPSQPGDDGPAPEPRPPTPPDPGPTAADARPHAQDPPTSPHSGPGPLPPLLPPSADLPPPAALSPASEASGAGAHRDGDGRRGHRYVMPPPDPTLPVAVSLPVPRPRTAPHTPPSAAASGPATPPSASAPHPLYSPGVLWVSPGARRGSKSRIASPAQGSPGVARGLALPPPSPGTPGGGLSVDVSAARSLSLYSAPSTLASARASPAPGTCDSVGTWGSVGRRSDGRRSSADTQSSLLSLLVARADAAAGHVPEFEVDLADLGLGD